MFAMYPVSETPSQNKIQAKKIVVLSAHQMKLFMMTFIMNTVSLDLWKSIC